MNEKPHMQFDVLSPTDFDAVQAFYYDVIDDGARHPGSNAAGWTKGVYPSDAMLHAALEAGEFYGARDEDGHLAVITIANTSCNEGYEGMPWPVDCAPGEFMVPHALATAPAHRHEGWGRAAILFVLDLARERGMRAVRLDVLSGNVAAEELYKSVGFYLVGPSWMFYEDTGWTEYILYEHDLSEQVDDGQFHPRSRIDQGYAGRKKAPAGKGPSQGITPEMEELAYRITHPEGDPNTNFRRMGFGGSHLG